MKQPTRLEHFQLLWDQFDGRERPAGAPMGTSVLLALLLASFLVGSIAQAAPRAKLWHRWSAHDPQSSVTVDHGDWNRLLANYVVRGGDDVNRLEYAAVGEDDRKRLRNYLAMLGRTPVSRLSRDEQFAYWINLYNALTVNLVLDHYPVTSIRKIGGGPFSAGPWGRKIFAVEGVELSLDDIEHRILRPLWRDPRIHYAVNCAAVGCPELAARAYQATQMEEMLESAARRYVNHPRGVALANHRLKVSSIYVWYREDFGGGDSQVIAHLKAYAAPDLARALSDIKRIDSHDYDWSLNDPRQ
ncbi:MAG: DUF547 domain-containing protein [Sphingomonadales bacterium]